uniref:C-type lectin lectoxin-Thr1-like n=1 Tax=Styela clava TaxID=7725 RepID=UPI0019396BAA|nr:C-type lectin lectoxin-Thr1-like [Styela clava]
MQQIQGQLRNPTSVSPEIANFSTWYRARNNYFYKVFEVKATYVEAKANCKKYGGQLASTGYRDDNVRREILPLVRTGGHTWIGLNDIQHENTFVWEDGVTAKADSIPWHEGEPNDANGNEDCVDIASGFDWNLNDQYCGAKLQYLCEIAT